MQLPRIFNLGESIVTDAVIADCPMTKQALSEVLETSRPTICRYDAIAYYCVADYKDDYPAYPREQWLVKKAKHDRTVPLSPYQIWVVSGVQICFNFYGKKEPAENYIKENPHILSRSRYDQRLRQLANAANNSKAS
jgi:hypothetical protein